MLNMSVTQIDAPHTSAQRDGEKVEYQGRKKRKTTNSLYVSDRQGLSHKINSLSILICVKFQLRELYHFNSF